MKEKILELLNSTNGFVSGQALAEEFGISRQAVSKAVAALREQGYEIDAVPNKGYRLNAAPEILNVHELKRRLTDCVFGKNIIVLDSVDSTNDYLKRLAAENAESGTVVAAREQLKGKGRLGRAWQGKPDDSVMFSLLLRPTLAPYEVSAVTPLAGLAVCKALREFTEMDCRIKWPNDVISGNKKLTGILTEMSAEFDAVEYIVIGIGINIDQEGFSGDIAHKATSVYLETGRHFDKNELLACVLKHLERELLKNNLTLTHEALSEYADLCATIGRNVSFIRGGKNLNGIAKAVDSCGELTVKLSDGEVLTVNAGEITVQGIY